MTFSWFIKTKLPNNSYKSYENNNNLVTIANDVFSDPDPETAFSHYEGA